MEFDGKEHLHVVVAVGEMQCQPRAWPGDVQRETVQAHSHRLAVLVGDVVFRLQPRRRGIQTLGGGVVIGGALEGRMERQAYARSPGVSTAVVADGIRVLDVDRSYHSLRIRVGLGVRVRVRLRPGLGSWA